MEWQMLHSLASGEVNVHFFSLLLLVVMPQDAMIFVACLGQQVTFQLC